MPSLNQDLHTLIGKYDVQTIVSKLAEICYDKADGTEDNKLSNEYHKLGNKLQHVADTTSINELKATSLSSSSADKVEAARHWRRSWYRVEKYLGERMPRIMEIKQRKAVDE